ncbi:Flp family type IVb pilin [Clostridium sp. chh4-2]|uniref:Flp family type IVb pilin n=1 Tax=Clostridium sp. chh4-2 TaxID=2067550 RepID=UPI000CCE4A1A|nr:Flp family type IVb pilin [Clostridium sp. chh4-2]PNV63833.1 Flp family type IVb pilin [Clostridium sp. chh4-2]
MKSVKWLVEEESGQGLAEYALILMLVAAVTIGLIKELGLKVSGFFAEAEAYL